MDSDLLEDPRTRKNEYPTILEQIITTTKGNFTIGHIKMF
jgi:hypothetical protein